MGSSSVLMIWICVKKMRGGCVIQEKIYSVGSLGLPEQEFRMLKSMLRLTASRPQGSYELSEGIDIVKNDIVIINTDDAGVMITWQEMTKHESAPVPILVSAVAMAYSNENYFMRPPFSPTRVLTLLDKVVADIQSLDPESQVFAGKGNGDSSIHSATAGQTSAAGGMQFRRALVVDDSPTVRKQLELELQASNIYVDSAETGEAALEMVGKTFYDIVFLDVVLPGVDGYQVCKSIKKNPAAKHTPVVMLTSKSSPFDRVRGSLAGCNSYLTKPVDYEKFRHVLEEYNIVVNKSAAKTA